MNVKGFKQKLFKEIKRINIKGIVSISLVGSFQYARKLEKVNDIDIVIIVKKLSIKNLEEIEKTFTEISRKLENKKIKIENIVTRT